MLINRLYDSYRDNPENDHENPNYDIGDKLDHIIIHSALSEGFDNLQFYSDKLLSKENKYQFTDYISKKIVEKISTQY